MGPMRRVVLMLSLLLCLVDVGPALAKPPHPNTAANNSANVASAQNSVGTQQIIVRRRRLRRLLRRWRRIEHRRHHRRWLRHHRWWLRHHHKK